MTSLMFAAEVMHLNLSFDCIFLVT